jgi:hypothetical protein
MITTPMRLPVLRELREWQEQELALQPLHQTGELEVEVREQAAPALSWQAKDQA